MKKFVGTVNGKEYSCVEDFRKAIDEAVKSDPSTLVVSSKYVECDCDSCKKNECTCGCDKSIESASDEKKPFDVDSILLNRNSKKYENGQYVIPADIREKFKNASNLDDIKKNLNKQISVNKNIVDYNIKAIHGNNNEIGLLKRKNSSLTSDKDDAERQIEYYEKLIDLMTNSDAHEVEVFEQISSIFGVGFDNFLTRIGFWN